MLNQNKTEKPNILETLKQEQINALRTIIDDIQKYEKMVNNMRFPAIRYRSEETQRAIRKVSELAHGGIWDRGNAHTIMFRTKRDQELAEHSIEDQKLELIGKLVLMEHNLDKSSLDDDTKKRLRNYIHYQRANLEGKQLDANMSLEKAQELTAYLQAKIDTLNS